MPFAADANWFASPRPSLRRTSGHRMHVRVLAAAALLLPAVLLAQSDRYELGLRLRGFERSLGAATSAEAAPRRSAALAELNGAVQAFFRLDLPAVAKAIAAAEAALRGKPFTPAEAFAQRLQLQLGCRLAATGAGELAFTVSTVWKGDDEPVTGLRLRAVVACDGAKLTDLALAELPATGALSLRSVPAGDHTVRWQVLQGDTVLLQREQALSLAADLDRRLETLPGATATDDGEAPRTIEALTLRAHARTLAAMTRKRAEETVLPGERLLREAEALVASKDAPWYGPQRPGQYWLRVPVAKATFAVRLLVPAAAEAGAKVPLLLALHGAGGSENLFFDGYGDGAAVAAAAARGFYVCAPRLGFGSLDLPSLIDALAARYPIDPARVLLVGHSMGAMQAVAAAQGSPNRFLAVAALGGGGAMRARDGSALPPFFVGVGERDFARAGARQLHDQLRARGASSELHEYPDVEHLAIVQLGCADLFAFFDGALRRR